MEKEYIEPEYAEFRGRRKACKAQGLRGKAFRQCVRKLRRADKGLSKSEKKKLAKQRRHDWRKVKKDVKLKWREEGKGFFRKVWRVQAKVSFLGFRAPFLALVRINMFGLATKIGNLEKQAQNPLRAKKQRNWRKLKVRWLGWGGNQEKLMKSVRVGYVRKPVFSKIRSVKGFDGSEEYEITLSDTPYSSVEGLWEGVAIAAASTIITSIIQLLGNKAQQRQMMDAETQANLGEMALQTIDDDNSLTEEQKRVASAVVENSEEENDEEIIMGMPKNQFIIAASLTGILVLVGGVLIYKKINK